MTEPIMTNSKYALRTLSWYFFLRKKVESKIKEVKEYVRDFAMLSNSWCHSGTWINQFVSRNTGMEGILNLTVKRGWVSWSKQALPTETRGGKRQAVDFLFDKQLRLNYLKRALRKPSLREQWKRLVKKGGVKKGVFKPPLFLTLST